MAADAATSGGGAAPTIVENSALFNNANSESLSRTPSSAGNRKTWTFSHWIYKASVSGAYDYFSAGDNNTNHTSCRDVGNGQLNYRHQDGGAVNDSVVPSRLLRDNAWYHVVWAVDTTQSDAFERVKIYINNELQTVFATSNYPAQNADTDMNSTEPTIVGARTSGPDQFYPGYMAETILIDGLQLSPSSFGEYDTTGLYWTPKSSIVIKELTFGTNGFYLDNTTNAQTDASGEGNNFTNNNTVVTSTHTPTHLDSLYNQLDRSYAALSNGNRTSTGANSWGNRRLVLPMGTGKWYTEFTCAGAGYIMIGVGNNQVVSYTNVAIGGQAAGGYQYFATGGGMYKNGVSSSYGTAWASGTNVIGVAFNGDIGALWFSLNGTWQASATISEVAAGTTTNAAATSLTGGEYSLWTSVYHAGGTVISKEEADFSYTIPTGFTSVTSTNLTATTSRTASDTNKYFQTTLYEGNGTGQRVGAFQPFDNTFTVAKSGLWSASGADLTRGSMSGTTTTWTFSAWIKRSEPAVGAATANFVFTTASNAGLSFGNNSTADLIYWYSGSYTASTRSLSDKSQWYHVAVKNDGGTGTIYLNGNEVLGSVTVNAADATMAIGSYNGSSNEFDGYIAEVVFIDGSALAPSSFGQVDTSTNRWVPKDVSGLTYDGNSFYLNFADSSDLGNDVGGGNKDFTNNSGVLSSTDSPTTNFGTLAVQGAACTVTNGDRTNQGASGGYGNATSGLSFKHEKIFCALLIVDGGSGAQVNTGMSVVPDTYTSDPNSGGNVGTFANIQTYGTTLRVIPTIPGTPVVIAHSIAVADGDYFTCAVDPDQGNIWFGFYDTSAGTHQYLPSTVGGTAGNPADGTLPTIPGRNFNSYAGIRIQISGYTSSAKCTLCLASGDLPITPPTDFLTFQQDNLTGTEQFQSAFSWIKNRDATDNHMLFDRVRGATKDWHSNLSDIQVTNVNTVQRFLEAGVQVGNDVEVNTASESYVLWNWMMEATGSGASNTAGSINTISTLVDQTLGLSISTYTGTGNTATVGHGLGVTPSFVIIKVIDTAASGGYGSFPKLMSANYNLYLTGTGGQDAGAAFDTSENSSTVVGLTGSSGATNGVGRGYVMYAFAPSQFISIGSYEGNGNANGAFIPTLNSLGVPIQPVWAITKSIDSTSGWNIYDKERLGYNPENAHLVANATTVESTADDLDIVTGGLKMRIATDPNVANTSGYMAIGTPIIDVDGRIIAGR